MIRKIVCFYELDQRGLMDIYAEGNAENAEELYPEEPDRGAAVGRVEADFMDYLQNQFFPRPGSAYWLLEEEGQAVSALRTSLIEPGLYYIEALETRPDSRRKGYGSKLLSGVLTRLKGEGAVRICDCVHKKNLPSVKTHERCGFRIVSEAGYDYLSRESKAWTYGFAYSYPET